MFRKKLNLCISCEEELYQHKSAFPFFYCCGYFLPMLGRQVRAITGYGLPHTIKCSCDAWKSFPLKTINRIFTL